jgi:hypothetical protein
MVQRLKELHRMHRGLHGFPDLIEDHLSERVLGNVCRVLEPSGNTLKDHDSRDDLVLSENTV